MISKILDAISLRRAISDEIAAAEREDRNPRVANITARIAAVWGIMAVWGIGALGTLAIGAAILLRGVR